MELRDPVRYQRYTLAEIANALMLKDSPALSFFSSSVLDNKRVLQDGKFSLEELCEKFPEIAATEWTYTDEWIPLFAAVDDKIIEGLTARYRSPIYGEAGKFYEEVLYTWAVAVDDGVQLLKDVA